MTQHIMAEDTEQDIRTMKNLRNFILGFVGVAILLAVGVGVFAP
jgi:hypothetical protein